MKLLDCTLRDGANVIGKGFDAKLTVSMIKGLIASNITLIEMGNCLGLGAYEANGSISPLNDTEYLALVQPYLSQAEIGMFIGYKNTSAENISLAADNGLHFLRVGANAGDGAESVSGIKRVKDAGLTCRYSLMKGYILSAQELAKEARMLEQAGLDEITIMDSAGTMYPEQVALYVSEMVKAVDIPVGFHGHNNLSLSMANAQAAEAAGAGVLDSGLLGMARSAGNLSTEVAVAVFQRMGKLEQVDLYTLLHYLDKELIPQMANYDYNPAIQPIDLVYGLAGCHSSFAALFDKAAKELQVDLYKLIVEVSRIDQKAPSEALIRKIAQTITS